MSSLPSLPTIIAAVLLGAFLRYVISIIVWISISFIVERHIYLSVGDPLDEDQADEVLHQTDLTYQKFLPFLCQM